MSYEEYDAIVVGAGFAGIYQLYRLREQNLSVILIEAGEDVGGTWHWNRYPGASSDVHSFTYRYSWDKELLQTYPWKNHYLTQPEVQAYLRNVVDKHGLRKYIRFNTHFTGAKFDEQKVVWAVDTSDGKALTTHYLFTALGALSDMNYPDIKNLNSFEGEVYHTAAWPSSYDFHNKRIGIVGNGSTGSQLLVALAKEAKHVTSFQRNAQWNVPNGNRPVPDEERAEINANYNEIWDAVHNSAVAFGFPESTIPTFSVDDEERRRRFQEAWDKGNGFRFMFGVFSDTTTNRSANDAACAFIQSKIEEIVKDPVTRQRLIPTEPYARRPICNNGYYETFNQENVSLVSLKETPFTEITTRGVKTSDGVEHELDVLIFATGFDAVTGSYSHLDIRGRDGQTLKEHWAAAPTSYLGFSASSFPNLFLISGPHHPFTNAPPQIEAQVNFISDLVAHVGTLGTVEATAEAEQEFSDLSNEIVKGTIFHEPKGWVFGDNVKGKKHSTLFWFGGLKAYREYLRDVEEKEYKGYRITRENAL
ncbi:FAD/NAD(P)-binding domain-containing protein [Cucurbitaria berberidis CBS 394.84]|uniref:FAD/NAD(P)-binding domain-containing protein n=1 Tax=Cucurbitaria berberidis CBS 394.84 TaxID=1168544 RepID=A0A9P4GKY4_9PLEO|nr:FAD/NAD(P)-binding domain-containing protein [Cucurbitaria berberidis CBS 394.84]KAF1847089.1 FAD/NAD(P)-binding domain-containing protein [Cucurbitaria berberidis CBS 394.84]